MALDFLPHLFKHRLKLRLALLIAAVALLLTTLSSQFVGHFSTRQINNDKGILLRELATQMADRLSQDMDTRAGEIRFLTRLADIRSRQTPLEEKQALLEQTKANYPHYAWIGLTDEQGNILAGTGGMLVGKSVAQRDWFLEGSQGLHFGNAHDAFLLAKLMPKPQWDDLPLRLVDLSAPVLDAEGRLLGVICGHLSLDWAFEARNRMLSNLTEPGVEMVVLNRDGKVLMGTPQLPSLQVDLGALPTVAEGRAGKPQARTERWPDQADYLTVAVPEPEFGSYTGMGWMVVAREPVSLAFAPARELGNRVFYSGILFSLLFATLLWVILNRQLRPLERLGAAAERIRAGATDTPIPQIAGDDEIAVFSRSLTNLVATLQGRNEELRLTSRVFEESSQGIAIADASEQILRVNRAFSEITGYSPAEVIGKTPRLLKSGVHDAPFYQRMWDTLAHDGVWRGEIWNRSKQGRIYPEWININALRDADGQISHYIALFEDTTEKKEYEERLIHLANFDVLTQLPNRHLLQQRLSMAIEQAEKDQGGLALLFLDLDHFKHINDTLGHPAGDKVLQEVAQRYSSALPTGTTLARWGGDEFVAVLPGAEARHSAATADGLLHAMDAPFLIEGREYAINASIGLALFPGDGGNVDALLRCADTAMYQAKEQGKNRYCFYEGRMNLEMEQFLRLSNALRNAAANGELQMAYQPQYDTAGTTLVSAEALLRWSHPEMGAISPGEFIPIAEETGLIRDLGLWVVREVLHAQQEIRNRGLRLVPVAVNFSTRQVIEPGLPALIHALMEESGLAPALFKIEVTESAIMADEEQARHNLDEFKRLGYSISIDDFGTGYSCLAYVTRLRPNELKIDKSFVQSLGAEQSADDVVFFTVDLARHMGMAVVAEGVETEDQLARLQQMGQVQMQGFLLSRPLPFEAFCDLLKPA